MALFLGLYLGHILGDFVFQPGKLVAAKRERSSAAVLHCAIVTLCTALALAGLLRAVWPAVLIAGITHLGVEQLSIGARRSTDASGLTVFLLDQGLHVVSLAMIAMLSSARIVPVIGIWPTSLEFLAMLCGVVTVAFAGSILVFEVRVAHSAHAVTPPILGFDSARAYGMGERALALLVALLAPTPLVGAVAFAPRMITALATAGDTRARHVSAAAVGLSLTAIAWVLVTSVSLTQ